MRKGKFEWTRGRFGITPRILNLDTRVRWMVIFILQLSYLPLTSEYEDRLASEPVSTFRRRFCSWLSLILPDKGGDSTSIRSWRFPSKSFPIYHLIKDHLSFSSIVIQAESVFKSPTKEFNTKHHSIPRLWFTWSTVGVQTPPASRKAGYIGLPNSVSTKEASDASDPSPGPWFPHSLAISSAPCFILFEKESWDHVWWKGSFCTPYCHVPPYKTYTSIEPQRGTVWDHTQHRSYANISYHSYIGPLYDIRVFFSHNFKQFMLRQNSIRKNLRVVWVITLVASFQTALCV
jgi:hypothetical protein